MIIKGMRILSFENKDAEEKITRTGPLLRLKYERSEKGQIYTVLRVSKVFVSDFLMELYRDDDMFFQLDRALPMMYPPARWKDFNLGAYYLKPSLVLRYLERDQLSFLQRADMRRVYKSRKIID